MNVDHYKVTADIFTSFATFDIEYVATKLSFDHKVLSKNIYGSSRAGNTLIILFLLREKFEKVR